MRPEPVTVVAAQERVEDGLLGRLEGGLEERREAVGRQERAPRTAYSPWRTRSASAVEKAIT